MILIKGLTTGYIFFYRCFLSLLALKWIAKKRKVMSQKSGASIGIPLRRTLVLQNHIEQ
jgi:hypothetical protein